MARRQSAMDPQVRPAQRGTSLSDWPPACWHPDCTFRGEPGPESTPYIACGGNERRHIRPPVDGAR